MIFDNIENALTYYNLDKKFEVGLKYIKETDLLNIENGEYSIIPNIVKVNIQEYKTKPEGQFEAHKKYIDIQYMIKGSEKIGICDITKLKEKITYSDKKDICFLEGKGDFITLQEGDFAVFYPQDAHMPCIKTETEEIVKKAVIKILI